MLVQRWAILRAPIPRGITIKRTVAMVNALAKLHNFCIDEKEADVPALPPRDLVRVMTNERGFLPMEESGPPLPPRQLLDGGDHFDDFHWDVRRPPRRGNKNVVVVLPRDVLLEHIIDSHMVRPSINVYK